MAIKNALRLRVTGKQTSSGLFTLYTEPVESGRAYCFQDIVFNIDRVLEDDRVNEVGTSKPSPDNQTSYPDEHVRTGPKPRPLKRGDIW